MKPERQLSTLEQTVLGLVWLRGPCRIYSVMLELSKSASSYHKSRAGTAYTVSNRLLKFGLLERAETEEDADQHVRITEIGHKALVNWLSPPIPETDIFHTADLVRLRMFFLEAIPPQDRLALIDTTIESLKKLQSRCFELMRENEDIGEPFGVLATASVVLETKARLKWLKLVRVYIADPASQPDLATTLERQLK